MGQGPRTVIELDGAAASTSTSLKGTLEPLWLIVGQHHISLMYDTEGGQTA